MKDYAEAARSLAQRKGVQLVDVYARYKSYDEQDARSMDDLFLDGMHPNAKGHRLVADLSVPKTAALLKPAGAAD